MNQDKIANTIKNIRKNNNLTQEAFAEEFNVTYQAVSKWENGKSIPDIQTLQLICKKYKIDINELLDNDISVKQNTNLLYFAILGVVLTVGIIIGIIHIKTDHHSFETRELGASCKDFTLSGTVSYDKSKSHIYINNIDYCGKEDNNTYMRIESTLYSIYSNKESIISSGDKINNITLNNYLKELKFNVSSNSCNFIQGSELKLVIMAYTEDNKATTFEIPLKLGDTTC